MSSERWIRLILSSIVGATAYVIIAVIYTHYKTHDKYTVYNKSPLTIGPYKK